MFELLAPKTTDTQTLFRILNLKHIKKANWETGLDFSFLRLMLVWEAIFPVGKSPKLFTTYFFDEKGQCMTTPGDFRGSRLLDFKVKATKEGCLDIFVLTDKGAFELLHDSIEVYEGGTGGFESRIPSEYKGAEVKDLWTDGESLFIELQDESFVVYEFALAQSGGSAESLRFASKPADLKPILDYLGDPEMRKLLV